MSERDHQEHIVPLTKPEAAAIRKLRQPRERKVTKRFVIEGVRAVNEALRAGLGMHRAVVSPRLEDIEGGSKIRAALSERGVPLAEVPDRTLKGLSDTDSPQGVVVVGIEPPISLSTFEASRGVLALDGIQDPGNVGTLIRSAHAFGLGGVVALEGTADPWGAKAVRASAGSLFHLPVSRSSTPDFLSWCGSGSDGAVRILAAAPGSTPPGPASARWVLVVGSEGKGIREILLGAADEIISVAMPGGSESLNAAVAGSLLLHELVTSRESQVHKMEAQ